MMSSYRMPENLRWEREGGGGGRTDIVFVYHKHNI